MPNNAMARKIIATEDCGATVVCSGPTWQERDAVLTALQKEIGSTLISTSTDPKIFLGQGTLGIEFADQMKQVYGNQLDAIIAPYGSGGMLAGLAVALRDTSTRIFGSEPAEGGADDAKKGRDIGSRIGTVQSSSIADGLRCPVGKLPWEIIKRLDYVEDIFSVTDEQIEITMKLLFEEFRMIVEPSAAVPLAVVFFNPEFKDFAAGYTGPLRVGIVLSGGNVDLQNIVDICS
jgi:threonine dehydratase